MSSKNYIIFTDLDGTLLDHETYSFSKAKPALEIIKQRKIPIILTSSKTRVEMADYQKEMGIETNPFIVENGSAIYSNINFFENSEKGEIFKSYSRFCLGKTYSEIKNILTKISNEYGYTIKGFHNSDKQEIINQTNLNEEAVELAINREFSVPLFYNDKAEQILLKEIQKYNLKILYGGRFMHLLGETDKGRALDFVRNAYSKKWNSSKITTIAIGDTLNDIAMLEKADIKILVKRFNNEYDKRVKIEKLIYSPYIGPKGWNKSLLEILNSGKNNG